MWVIMKHTPNSKPPAAAGVQPKRPAVPAEAASGNQPRPRGIDVEDRRGDRMLEQLTALTGVLARGEAPRDVAPYVAGAALFPLAKKAGGVRPIASAPRLKERNNLHLKMSHTYLMAIIRKHCLST